MRVKSGPLIVDFRPPVVNFWPLRIICQKRPFFKKHNTLMPIFCHKKRTFSQKHCSHVISSTFFMKNPQLSCIYLVKKCKFCKSYTILRVKKVNKMSCFSEFSRKIAALMPVFCKKSPFSKKTHNSHAHILS